MPVERIDEKPAEHRGDAAAARAYESVHAHRFGAVTGFGEHIHDQRQRNRIDDRTAEALNRTRDDEHRLRIRQARTPSDASVNSAMPMRNSARCPYRSPSRPPSKRNPPDVSRYALITHASELSENFRFSRIVGSATFTIVISSTIINTPRHSTRQRKPALAIVRHNIIGTGHGRSFRMRKPRVSQTHTDRMRPLDIQSARNSARAGSAGPRRAHGCDPPRTTSYVNS